MEGNTCGGAGGWTHLDLLTCLILVKIALQHNNDMHILISITVFVVSLSHLMQIVIQCPFLPINYTTVFGRAISLISNDAFHPNVGAGSADINGLYIDGYSITYVNP